MGQHARLFQGQRLQECAAFLSVQSPLKFHGELQRNLQRAAIHSQSLQHIVSTASSLMAALIDFARSTGREEAEAADSRLRT